MRPARCRFVCTRAPWSARMLMPPRSPSFLPSTRTHAHTCTFANSLTRHSRSLPGPQASWTRTRTPFSRGTGATRWRGNWYVAASVGSVERACVVFAVHPLHRREHTGQHFRGLGKLPPHTRARCRGCPPHLADCRRPRAACAGGCDLRRSARAGRGHQPHGDAHAPSLGVQAAGPYSGQARPDAEGGHHPCGDQEWVRPGHGNRDENAQGVWRFRKTQKTYLRCGDDDDIDAHRAIACYDRIGQAVGETKQVWSTRTERGCVFS